MQREADARLPCAAYRLELCHGLEPGGRRTSVWTPLVSSVSMLAFMRVWNGHRQIKRKQGCMGCKHVCHDIGPVTAFPAAFDVVGICCRSTDSLSHSARLHAQHGSGACG